MKMSKIKKLLYRSLDEDLNEKDRRKLEAALAQDPELRKEKAHILKQRRLIADSRSEGFAPGFSQRVMARVAEAEENAARNHIELAYETMTYWFRRLAVIGALAVFLLLALNLTMKNLSPENEIFYTSAVTYEEIQNLPLF
jgi:anti-sigma factor RsiW